MRPTFKCVTCMAIYGLVSLLLFETPWLMAKSPRFSLSEQNQPEERDRLSKQVEELRRAGKLNEAVAAAERVERRAGAGELGRG